MRHTYFAVQQLEKSADIYIFGDIVRQEKSERDVATNGIIGQIKALDAEKINVYIDSYGGAVSEGWAIYNALREHPAQVDTYGMGFVASAAVFPFLAGGESLCIKHIGVLPASSHDRRRGVRRRPASGSERG